MITFGGLFGIGLRFTLFVKFSRLVAGWIAVSFQIIDSRHWLIHTSAPCAFLVSTRYDQQSIKKYASVVTTHPGIAFLSWLTFFALLLYGLGLLAGLVALFETQSTRPHVSVWVAFRPLTLHISAWRGAAGCCVSGRETSIETIGRNVSLKRIERNFFKGDIRISLITPSLCTRAVQSILQICKSKC